MVDDLWFHEWHVVRFVCIYLFFLFFFVLLEGYLTASLFSTYCILVVEQKRGFLVNLALFFASFEASL